MGTWNTNTNATAYQSDVTFSDQTDAYYQVRFTGTRVELVTEKHDHMGIVAVSVDGGAETMVDLYSATAVGQQLVYTSPALTAGPHILKVRVTGTKNPSSGWTWTTADRVDIIS